MAFICDIMTTQNTFIKLAEQKSSLVCPPRPKASLFQKAFKSAKSALSRLLSLKANKEPKVIIITPPAPVLCPQVSTDFDMEAVAASFKRVQPKPSKSVEDLQQVPLIRPVESRHPAAHPGQSSENHPELVRRFRQSSVCFHIETRPLCTEQSRSVTKELQWLIRMNRVSAPLGNINQILPRILWY